ncbi:hypothetical protein CW731_14180 [Polaribacter sp. ALD11]|nr:hypothetical protein CW731_14180 [Polaribacter sp. ALD11]
MDKKNVPFKKLDKHLWSFVQKLLKTSTRINCYTFTQLGCCTVSLPVMALDVSQKGNKPFN